MAGIRLVGLVKRYDDNVVIPEVNLEIADREFMVFVGPSGCGKSTLLRTIAGLETVDGGELWIGERRVNDLGPAERDIAMVFQDYALYPHMTVFQNMAFGLEMRNLPKADIRRRVTEAARMLRLEQFLERRPKALSGGQRQRVAMGRAIVREPAAFLFDEPLSNLDAKLRMDVRTEIKRLHRQLRTTMIFVTHDQVEAMTMADRIVVLKGGIVQQVGTPEEIYDRPANQFVAGFIGAPTMNFFPAHIDAADGKVAARLANGALLSVPPHLAQASAAAGAKDVIVGLRPEHVVARDSAHPEGFAIEIDVTEPLGSDTFVFFRVGESHAVARLSPHLGLGSGSRLEIGVATERMQLFDPKTGDAIR